MTLEAEVLAVRRGVGLFELEDRGLVEVTGSDARRWLNGMVTNDVAQLAEGPERSGCPALVLTSTGRVVTDLHVLQTRRGYWLELPRGAVGELMERLSKLVIADDVRLADRSDAFARFGLEGPAAATALERVVGSKLGLAPAACVERTFSGIEALVARFGVSGEEAYQLFVPRERGAEAKQRLLAEAPGCSAEALEVLRIEAGQPRLGAELSLDVLPPEARLEPFVSYTKGCYTGQEIVARLRSRGHVNHLLVGLRLEAGAVPARGARVVAAGVLVGEITSAARSPHVGLIALAFVRVGYDAPGTALDVEGAPARVVALPFVAPSAPAA